MRRLGLVALLAFTCAGCFSIETNAGAWRGYQTQPLYALGVPFNTVDPAGRTVLVPGSIYRNQSARRGY